MESIAKNSGSSSVSWMDSKSVFPQSIPMSMDFSTSQFLYSLDGDEYLSIFVSKSTALSICPGINRPP